MSPQRLSKQTLYDIRGINSKARFLSPLPSFSPPVTSTTTKMDSWYGSEEPPGPGFAEARSVLSSQEWKWALVSLFKDEEAEL